MLNTTLCYVTRGSQVLMLHRVKKKADINKDKWIGIGGKFENEESPDECLLREAKEETGLTLTSWQCRGVVTFLNDTCGAGISGHPAQVGGRPDFSGSAVAERAVLPADAALPRGCPGGSGAEWGKDTLNKHIAFSRMAKPSGRNSAYPAIFWEP